MQMDDLGTFYLLIRYSTTNMNSPFAAGVKVAVIASESGVYNVDYDELIHASPFFCREIGSVSGVFSTLELRVPETPNTIIDCLVRWIYNQDLPFCLQNQSSEQSHQQQKLAVRLWVFAETYQIRALQNVAMRYLYVSLEQFYPTTQLVREVYESTSPESLLRKIMLREVITGLRDEPDGDGGYTPDELEALGTVSGFTTDVLKKFATILYQRHHDVERHWLMPTLL